MKQRVGFARALVVEPEVLFMDEPFSALDVLTAENLVSQVVELWIGKQLSTEAIFIVTHNIEGAVLPADREISLGKNPARIRAEFGVTLPQPRDQNAHWSRSAAQPMRAALTCFRSRPWSCLRSWVRAGLAARVSSGREQIPARIVAHDSKPV